MVNQFVRGKRETLKLLFLIIENWHSFEDTLKIKVSHNLGQREYYFASITLFFSFISMIVSFTFVISNNFTGNVFLFSIFSWFHQSSLLLHFFQPMFWKSIFLSQGSFEPLYPSEIRVKSVYTPPFRNPTRGTISGMLLFVSILKKD